MRYTIEITREMMRVLNRLKVSLDVETTVEVLRKAIALMKIAQDAKDAGKALYITKNGRIETEVVWP